MAGVILGTDLGVDVVKHSFFRLKQRKYSSLVILCYFLIGIMLASQTSRIGGFWVLWESSAVAIVMNGILIWAASREVQSIMQLLAKFETALSEGARCKHETERKLVFATLQSFLRSQLYYVIPSLAIAGILCAVLSWDFGEVALMAALIFLTPQLILLMLWRPVRRLTRQLRSLTS